MPLNISILVEKVFSVIHSKVLTIECLLAIALKLCHLSFRCILVVAVKCSERKKKEAGSTLCSLPRERKG